MHKIKKIPTITGSDIKLKVKKNKYPRTHNASIEKIDSLFGIALHMHQPTILNSDNNLQDADFINNLAYMMNHQNIGDNHNAPVFLWCYSRMSDFIRELVSEEKNPRVMLDYSGNLLWGLEQIDNGETLDKLKLITNNKKYFPYVEWLGTMFSHSVVSSTPIPDIKLHITAWQHMFSSIFGDDALKRVRGFSPPEMHLPIHPDICYEYIKTLKECGYQWLMVQEHTIENLDGSHIKNPYFPHKLISKNSLGEEISITVLIKTQGSDTKLVAQMQPYYEAKSKKKETYLGREIPPYVLQISDGENGGVMMNEFPPMYKKVFNEIGDNDSVFSMNGSEYLDFLKENGVDEKDFVPIQPIEQHKIRKHVKRCGEGAIDEAIEETKKEYPGFNLDKASWTSDKNWVKGYEGILDPITKLSAEFHKKFDNKKNPSKDPIYKEALLYLLLSETSCFRYWGEGLWTEYAKEITKRGMNILKDI